MTGPLAEWADLLGPDDLHTIAVAGFGGTVGIGPRPAVVVIDAQNFMLGPSTEGRVFPSACPTGTPALAATVRLLAGARSHGLPVIYTKVEYRRNGSDYGVLTRKRAGSIERLLGSEYWCIEGTFGAKLHEAVAPEPADLVLVKKRQSAFYGTPLASHLVERGIDSLILAGGSTSNCVRTSAIDAVAHNYRVTVARDAVFDRFELSHRSSLFDIARQYGDVRDVDDILEALR